MPSGGVVMISNGMLGDLNASRHIMLGAKIFRREGSKDIVAVNASLTV